MTVKYLALRLLRFPWVILKDVAKSLRAVLLVAFFVSSYIITFSIGIPFLIIGEAVNGTRPVDPAPLVCLKGFLAVLKSPYTVPRYFWRKTA